MGRLIDADALKDELLSWARVITNPKLLGTEDSMYVIDSAPTVDAVSVVRCGECKHSEHIKNAKGEDCAVCWNKQAPVFHEWCIPIDWFCADGERKDDATD